MTECPYFLPGSRGRFPESLLNDDVTVLTNSGNSGN